MKTLQKILLILVIAGCVMMVVPQTNVFAVDVVNTIDGVNPTADATYAGSLLTVVNRVLGFIQIASGLLSVVMIAWTGFRYIIETPEMKNELKKSLMPIIIGFLLVFMASTIAKFIIGIFQAGDAH